MCIRDSSVCVCKYHQNIKLMIERAKLNTSYRDMIDFLVCDIEKEECMLNDCKECPGPEALQILFNEIDNLPDEISFKQWVQTGRAELITQIQLSYEFMTSLVDLSLIHI